jgi:N-methylhydantoinase A
MFDEMQISVDVGGTFTDLVARFNDGRVIGYKTPSTRPNIIEGLFNGLNNIAAENGLSINALIEDLDRLDFGTTAATNALLEGKTAKTGLLITQGFRDTLLIREGGKEDSYTLVADYPEPFVPRALTFEIDERITAEGDIFRPLDRDSVTRVIEKLKAENIEAVAISFLWSIANPVHELEVAQMVREAMPDVAISIGHVVNPSIREYRRTIAASIDASLKPLVRLNVAKLDKLLADYGFAGKLSYITSTGGKASGADIIQRPVYLCFSGPSAAPEAARRFAQMEGHDDGNVVTVDMGGTSFDVSVVSHGKLLMHREGTIAGHMFGVPSVEIHSIGSGGGSITRVDAGGMLRVGPESAGSVPGPACYGRGGTSPTVTDANMVLGKLNGTFTSGSGMMLDREAAVAAIRPIAEQIGASLDETAALISHSTEQDMIGAIEAITIRRGIDPRKYLLVAGGAAVGSHAIAIAREIGMSKVIFPRMAGVLSAFGILAGEISFSFARSLFTNVADFDFALVKATTDALARDGLNFLNGMGVEPALQRLEFTCEARYRGQVWQLSVPFDPVELQTAEGIQKLRAQFNSMHLQAYGSASETDLIEIIEIGVRARGKGEDTVLPVIEQDPASAKPRGTRSVFFKQLDGRVDVPVYGPLALPVGVPVDGPILIDEHLTTLMIEPGSRVTLTPIGNYIVDL